MARRRGPSKNFWRMAIVGMIVTVLGLFGFMAFNTPPATDTLTACRTDRKDPAHTVILIDQSDPFQKNDFGWVEEFIDAEARSLPKYGRLTVLTPNVRAPYSPREVFSRCSSGANANPLFENPRMVEDTWRENFRDPLNKAVAGVMRDRTAPASPLVEAMYAIGDRADFQPGRPKRRVVIVSDLIHNSKAFSFYKRGADWGAFQESSLGADIKKVGGATVVARIVPRQSYDISMTDLKAFWSSYFRQADARFTAVN